jgi:hypothetical protein
MDNPNRLLGVKKQLFLRPSQAGAQFTQERKPVTELDSVSPAHAPLPGDEQIGKRNTVAGGGSSRNARSEDEPSEWKR